MLHAATGHLEPILPEGAPADPNLEILDGSRTVEVSVVHAGTPLLVRQLRGASGFSIGHGSKADLAIASAWTDAPLFPLVRWVGTHHVLLITAEMSGELRIGDSVTALSELARRGGAAEPSCLAPDGWELPIQRDASFTIVEGATVIRVRSVTPSRKLTSGPLIELDRPTRLFAGCSMLAHVALLTAALALPPSVRVLSADPFERDCLYIKVLPRASTGGGSPSAFLVHPRSRRFGAGQRHHGSEGTVGQKHPRRRAGRYALRGPADNPDPHLARRLALEAARNSGVLSLLGGTSGGALASSFGRDTALGRDAEDALGNLVGQGVGEHYGVGGLGLTGTGRGGGGTGEGTIALGSLYAIARGGVGSGVGHGRSAGWLGGHRATGPVGVIGGRAQVTGSLDKEVIRRVIRRHLNEVRYCYQKELYVQPALYGRVVMQFSIQPQGTVAHASVASSTLKRAAVERCLARAVRRWRFPKPKGGGLVVVTYPFVFKVAGG